MIAEKRVSSTTIAADRDIAGRKRLDMAEKRTKPWLCWLGAFLRDVQGATAVEYGILVMMVGLALLGMASLTDVADSISNTFAYVTSTLSH